jgi:large subunit ribosomal protein L22
MSPRKVRLVIDVVRGLPATTAETRLKFLQKGASLPVLKLLQSAMANAEHNFHLRKEDLVISTITADGGPTLKRSRARAFGRSAPIRKRTTHIQIVLTPKAEVKAAKAAKAKPETAVETTEAKSAEKKTVRKPNAKKPAAKDAEVVQS